jgi:dienelactone hydrolase
VIRATYAAVTVPGIAPPFATAHVKIFYEAVRRGDQMETATGELPAAWHGRRPVVLILPGVNVNPDGYRWLAELLVADGFVVAIPHWVGPLMPGLVGITPGVDIAAMTPERYGSLPACPLVRPVIEELRALDGGTHQLGGALDLTRVIIGGHSAGGSMALLSADESFHPEVVGAFAYGAHNQPSTALGWEPGTVLPYRGAAPLLLLAGTEDGVIKASAFRYGEEQSDARDPVRRTFDEAVAPDRRAWLVVIDGANHLLACDPHDATTARGFLEEPMPPDVERAARALLADAITAFCRTAALDAGAGVLDEWAVSPPAGVTAAAKQADVGR